MISVFSHTNFFLYTYTLFYNYKTLNNFNSAHTQLPITELPNFFFLRNLNKSLKFFYTKKYFTKNKFKFLIRFKNSFFFKWQQKHSLTPKSISSQNTTPNLFFNRYKYLFINIFYPLVGFKISYWNFMLKKKKKWFDRNFSTILRNNYRILRKPDLFFSPEFKFFKKLKTKYKNLKFLLRLIKKPIPIHTPKPIHIKPYLFLHSSRAQISKIKSPLTIIFQKFKRHKKIFKIFKKQGFRIRKSVYLRFLHNSYRKKLPLNFNPRRQFRANKRLIKKFYFHTKYMFFKNPCNTYKKYKTSNKIMFTFLKRKQTKSKNMFWLKKKIKFIMFFHKKKFGKFIKSKFNALFRRIWRQKKYKISRILYKFYRFSQKIMFFFYKTKKNFVLTFNRVNLASKFYYYKKFVRTPTRYNSISFFMLSFSKFKKFKTLFSSLFKNLMITSLHHTNFICSITGFLLLNNPLSNAYKYHSFKRIQSFKKILYSFSLKQDIAKNLLKKYSRKKISLDIKFFLKKKKNLEKKRSNFYLQSVYGTFNPNNENKNFLQTTALSSRIYKKIIEDPARFDAVKKKIGTWKKIYKIHIPRIRLKPGYKRIWKQARESLLIALNVKFKYQHKLTKFLILFNRTSKKTFYPFFEMRITNILIRARFVLDLNIAKNYIHGSLVFVNGISCLNEYFQLFVNDFVQLILSLKYYLTFRWFLNNTLKIKKKLKFLSWKSKKKNKEKDADKYINKKTSLAVLSKKYLNQDAPKFLEIDFLSLSFFVVYDPIFFSDLNHLQKAELKTNIFNMYNWKYIT